MHARSKLRRAADVPPRPLESIASSLDESKYGNGGQDMSKAGSTVAQTREQEKRNILVVDGDCLTLATIGKGLVKAGYDVLPAVSGADALRLAVENNVDLAMLDVSIPGMSGIEVARRLRETTHIPIMFLSARSEIDVVREATENGAIAYLVKPLNAVQIVPAIEAALARAAEIARLRHAKAELIEALKRGRETNMAVGILMERYRLNRVEAFEALRSYARYQRRKVGSVAEELLSTGKIPNLFRPRT